MNRPKTILFPEIERVQKWKVFLLFSVLLGSTIISIIGLVFATALYILLSILPRNENILKLFGDHLVILLALVLAISLILVILGFVDILIRGKKRLEKKLYLTSPDSEDRYHRIFENIVEELAVSAGCGRIYPQILPTKAINGVSFFDHKKRKVVALTEGAISKLNRSQLQGLAAICIARFATKEAEMISQACTLIHFYERLHYYINEILEGGGKKEEESSEAKTQKKIRGFISRLRKKRIKKKFNSYSHSINPGQPDLRGVQGSWIMKKALSFLSKENIFLADAVAVKLTRNPQALAEALHIAENSWQTMGTMDLSLAPLYIHPGNSKMFNCFSECQAHPFTIDRVDVLLRMGHISPSVLQDALKPSRRFFSLAPSHQEEPSLAYMAQFQGNWVGPFTPENLVQQNWLGLQTPVKNPGKEGVYPAYVVSGLLDLFPDNKKKYPHDCPACGGKLLLVERTGIPLLQCRRCKGILVKTSRLTRLLARRESPYDKTTVEGAEKLPRTWDKIENNPLLRRKGRLCPKCRREMENIPFSLASPVPVDLCPYCDYMWFDFKELDMVQYLMDRERLKREL